MKNRSLSDSDITSTNIKSKRIMATTAKVSTVALALGLTLASTGCTFSDPYDCDADYTSYADPYDTGAWYDVTRYGDTRCD